MPVLTFLDYCADYHKLLRQIWTNSGYDKWSSHHPDWIEFKVREYETYLEEVAKLKEVSFKWLLEKLNPKWLSFDEEYTEEQLAKDIDNITAGYLKNTKKHEPLWLLQRRISKK